MKNNYNNNNNNNILLLKVMLKMINLNLKMATSRLCMQVINNVSICHRYLIFKIMTQKYNSNHDKKF
jgi:hypothetical protein